MSVLAALHESGISTKRTKSVGQSMSALPGISDIDLLRYGERIIDFDPEIAHGAFHSRVPEQELHGTQIPGAAIDEGCLGSTKRMRPE
jgi:hypothetical protein